MYSLDSFGDYHVGAFHNVVVYPRSTEDVVKIVNIARKYLMPVIPYSGGTSVEGHTRGVSALRTCSDFVFVFTALTYRDGTAFHGRDLRRHVPNGRDHRDPRYVSPFPHFSFSLLLLVTVRRPALSTKLIFLFCFARAGF